MSLTLNPDLIKFIDLYIDCEIIAKKICDYFYIDTKNINYTSDKVNLAVVKAACKHFVIKISVLDLETIFSGGNPTAKKVSIRQLRNSYIHSKSEFYTNIALRNFSFYSILMNNFIKSITNHF